MGIRLLGEGSIFTSDAPWNVYDVDSDLSVADYCAELELATPLTGRVTNEGGTPAVRDTGVWYARCKDSDEVNAWVRVDNTTLTFADIYLSSESPTMTIHIVPGFSYDMEVWALDETNTVTYGDETSTDGSLVITLNLPDHITSKDLKKVYDGLEFTLGDGLVATEIWGKLDSRNPGVKADSLYLNPLGILFDTFSSNDFTNRLVPHAYDSTSFVTLTLVAGENVSLRSEYDFATTTIPVTTPAAFGNVVDLTLGNLYQATSESISALDVCIGETSVGDAYMTPLTEDAQVDIVGLGRIYVTLNVGDVTSVAQHGGGMDITDQLPKSFVIPEGKTLDYLIGIGMNGLTTTPTATGWKDMSDDTVILDTDVLVDGQSIYPYI